MARRPLGLAPPLESPRSIGQWVGTRQSASHDEQPVQWYTNGPAKKQQVVSVDRINMSSTAPLRFDFALPGHSVHLFGAVVLV